MFIPGPTGSARPTWDCGIERYTLAIARSAADDPGNLVAQHERTVDGGSTDTALEETVAVRAAQADCGHLEEHLAHIRHGRRLIMKSDVQWTMQTCCAHPMDVARRWVASRAEEEYRPGSLEFATPSGVCSRRRSTRR